MFKQWGRAAVKAVQNNRAQILLPAVLLAPIFILVIYLLFETSKVSMYKIRNQFALDNAAYSQMSSLSTYLNAAAYTNGNMPYRVMKSYNSDFLSPKGAAGSKGQYTVFDVFYQAGAFPALGPNHGKDAGNNPNPAPNICQATTPPTPTAAEATIACVVVSAALPTRPVNNFKIFITSSK